MTGLPRSLREKLDCLRAASEHKQSIDRLAIIGAPAEPLRHYLAAAGDLTVTRQEDVLRVAFADHLEWRFKVDRDDVLRGSRFSGFRGLMEALGIDFAGNPYVAGDAT